MGWEQGASVGCVLPLHRRHDAASCTQAMRPPLLFCQPRSLNILCVYVRTLVLYVPVWSKLTHAADSHHLRTSHRRAQRHLKDAPRLLLHRKKALESSSARVEFVLTPLVLQLLRSHPLLTPQQRRWSFADVLLLHFSRLPSRVLRPQQQYNS